MRLGCRILASAVVLLLILPSIAKSQGSSVANTVHNLSISGPGDIKSLQETEICKFCHTPHNTIVRNPLWGHQLSEVRNYSTPSIRRSDNRLESFPQPDGASRLCLSCHDGTIALGDVANESRPIAMSGRQRLDGDARGYLGTDLSGGHPISFVLKDITDSDPDTDMGLRSVSEIAGDPTIHLDANRKMQCTTCHNPHNDTYYKEGRVPHFWVKSTVEEVCLSCHVLR